MADVLRKSITQDLINRYGELNGDNDQLHYDADYARACGFRGTIAHGLMLLGVVSESAAGKFGPEWFEGGHVSMKWVEPTYAGDELAVALDEAGKVIVYAGENRTVALGTIARTSAEPHGSD
jgi:3-hydroxybutyryl-CoA dehydratase